MPIIETIVIRRRIPNDPAAPVIPSARHAWQDVRYRVPNRHWGTPAAVGPDSAISSAPDNARTPAPSGGPPPTVPRDGGNGTVPAGGSIPGTINQLAGPYAFPVGEIGLGAFFAVNQLQHVFERVAPGAAQLWRADGSGPAWHIVAALVGLAAAIHGITTLVKVVKAKKKAQHT